MKKVLFLALLLMGTSALSFGQKGNQREKPSAEVRVENRIQRLDKSLSLTAQQKEMLQKDLLRIEKARDEAREASMEQRSQQRALAEEEKMLLQKTLTEAQLKKLEEIKQERAREMKGRKALPDAPAQKQGE